MATILVLIPFPPNFTSTEVRKDLLDVPKVILGPPASVYGRERMRTVAVRDRLGGPSICRQSPVDDVQWTWTFRDGRFGHVIQALEIFSPKALSSRRAQVMLFGHSLNHSLTVNRPWPPRVAGDKRRELRLFTDTHPPTALKPPTHPECPTLP